MLVGAGSAHGQALPEPRAVQPAPGPRVDCAPTPFSPQAYLLDHEVIRQTLRVDDLRDARRRWQPSAVALALGTASLATGAVLLPRSVSDDDGINLRMANAGAIMVPLGVLSLLVAGPLFAVRGSRTLRLARAERALDDAMRARAAR